MDAAGHCWQQPWHSSILSALGSGTSQSPCSLSLPLPKLLTDFLVPSPMGVPSLHSYPTGETEVVCVDHGPILLNPPYPHPLRRETWGEVGYLTLSSHAGMEPTEASYFSLSLPLHLKGSEYGTWGVRVTANRMGLAEFRGWSQSRKLSTPGC